MSLTKAKQLYTRRKNALNRLLDPIPTLLHDQSVSRLKLEEARKRCNVAWDAFNAAHEELADAQSEDEAQALDAEEREHEFGNFEARYHNLVDSLAEAVASRDGDRVQQEEQAEAKRVQQEKCEQVTVHRLRLTSLYKGRRISCPGWVISWAFRNLHLLSNWWQWRICWYQPGVSYRKPTS